jgi:AcrR family transcriptional regulator
MSPDQRRETIVDAALAVAVRKGLAGTTVRDVAAEMGSSSGLIHHYFASMDDVLAAAFERVAERDLEATAAAMASRPTRGRRSSRSSGPTRRSRPTGPSSCGSTPGPRRLAGRPSGRRRPASTSPGSGCSRRRSRQASRRDVPLRRSGGGGLADHVGRRWARPPGRRQRDDDPTGRCRSLVRRGRGARTGTHARSPRIEERPLTPPTFVALSPSTRTLAFWMALTICASGTCGVMTCARLVLGVDALPPCRTRMEVTPATAMMVRGAAVVVPPRQPTTRGSWRIFVGPPTERCTRRQHVPHPLGLVAERDGILKPVRSGARRPVTRTSARTSARRAGRCPRAGTSGA